MAWIKIVPNTTPNAEGEWIDIPVEIPNGARWKEMEHLVKPFIPDGHFVVSVTRPTRELESLNRVKRL